jgi:hypothetical protein
MVTRMKLELLSAVNNKISMVTKIIFDMYVLGPQSLCGNQN